MTQHLNEPTATVYVVDDDASIRKALRRTFRSIDLEVESFASAREFLDYQRGDVPGCLVLDVNMPGLSGTELQEELVANHVNLPIVFMTGQGDIPMAVNAIQAGAVDFLPKPVDQQKLIQTVQKAIDEHARKREESAALDEFRERVKSLSKREREVMLLVISGMLNKQIARRLDITENTVKVHRGRAMEKSGVDSVAELVRLCERVGIAAAE